MLTVQDALQKTNGFNSYVYELDRMQNWFRTQRDLFGRPVRTPIEEKDVPECVKAQSAISSTRFVYHDGFFKVRPCYQELELPEPLLGFREHIRQRSLRREAEFERERAAAERRRAEEARRSAERERRRAQSERRALATSRLGSFDYSRTDEALIAVGVGTLVALGVAVVVAAVAGEEKKG